MKESDWKEIIDTILDEIESYILKLKEYSDEKRIVVDQKKVKDILQNCIIDIEILQKILLFFEDEIQNHSYNN